MITGATGSGKSSTINALFNTEVAKVGVGVDPETMDITKYDLDNLVLWDSPGLGDGKEADNRHANNIINKLDETDENGNLLIDLVLVILDGSTRDLGTSYELINRVIIPNLGKNKENRILVAINQADVAMKGKFWDYENNRPEPPLQKFLDEKVASVKRRIKEGTGVDVDPIYYCAGFKEEGLPQTPPYNLAKLLYYIIEHTPKEKRLVYTDKVNPKKEMWEDCETGKYRKSILKQLFEAATDILGVTLKKAPEVFTTTVTTVARTLGGIADTVVDTVSSAASAVASAGRSVVRTVSSWFGGGGGGGCYITTATCEEYGKPDDCYELTAFRNFRDSWLRRQPDGERLIAQYYRTAPRIVRLINRQPDRSEIYRSIRDNYLSKCLSYIESGDNEKCKELYVEMMEHLYEEQDRWH